MVPQELVTKLFFVCWLHCLVKHQHCDTSIGVGGAAPVQYAASISQSMPAALRISQAVPHSSTFLAQGCLSSVFEWEL